MKKCVLLPFLASVALSVALADPASAQHWDIAAVWEGKVTRTSLKTNACFRARRLYLGYPYLYSDATYLKVNWVAQMAEPFCSGHVGDLALLVVISVNEDGFREVLAVESAAGGKKEAHRNLLKGLIGHGLSGVQLVVSDDHESVKSAVQVELPTALFAGMQMPWQQCVVHFRRNILCHGPPQAWRKLPVI